MPANAPKEFERYSFPVFDVISSDVFPCEHRIGKIPPKGKKIGNEIRKKYIKLKKIVLSLISKSKL